MVKYLELIESYSDRCMVKTIDGDDCYSKSYSDYLKDIKLSAKKLEIIIGDVEGKHVGIIASSSYEVLVLLAAIIFSRGVAVPLNNKESFSNLKKAADDADLDLLICEDMTASDIFDDILIKKDLKDFFQDSESGKDLTDFTDDESDRNALIIYTSGTTSLSKGVVLSVGSLFGKFRNNLPDVFNGRENTTGITAYINMPFYHIGGIMPWLSRTEPGCTLCLSMDSRNIMADLEKNSIDIADVTPAVLKLWNKSLKHGKCERLGGVKYIYVGGAKLAKDETRPFFENGIDIFQLYGMTETGGDITINRDMKHHGDSVGKTVEGVEISIIDNEICVSSSSNMIAYYNNPEETEKTIKDGLVHTGDLGYMDNDGYVYITGRKKNLIILSGGENVSPEELEKELYKDEMIKECRVYEKDDRIVADIYAPGANTKEIKNYVSILNSSLPVYKRIYKIEIKENELEKTAIGKIKR